jgi:hypothetical protein
MTCGRLAKAAASHVSLRAPFPGAAVSADELNQEPIKFQLLCVQSEIRLWLPESVQKWFRRLGQTKRLENKFKRKFWPYAIRTLMQHPVSVK